MLTKYFRSELFDDSEWFTLRFIITLVKGVFDLQIDKWKNPTNLSLMNRSCETTTAHSQNISHWDTLYNIKGKKYKTVCAELPFSKVTFDGMTMIFIEFVFFSFLFAMQLEYCNIQSAWSKVGTPTVYMLISCILMLQNCIWSGKSCKMYAIFTMFSSSEVSFQHFQIK